MALVLSFCYIFSKKSAMHSTKKKKKSLLTLQFLSLLLQEIACCHIFIKKIELNASLAQIVFQGVFLQCHMFGEEKWASL